MPAHVLGVTEDLTMLYDALAKASREIDEHIADHPDTYRPHLKELREVQAHLEAVLERLARKRAA